MKYLYSLLNLKLKTIMKKILLVIALALVSFIDAKAQVEYKVITSVESIVPNGFGRSRMISASENKDYKEFTTDRTGNKETDKKNKSKREEIRIKSYEETKLLNFYNLGGIRFPDLPLILDPSHIAGNRDLIFDISQTALDLNFDGLMIETHHNPDKAWSDAAQQVTPDSLIRIMNDLKIRKETTPEAEYTTAINNLRAQIDVVDNQIIELLGKRMIVADGIGNLKKANNVSVLQTKRWNEILGKMVLEGQEKGLSEEFILRMFKVIHQESINHQEKIFKSNGR